jgi:hypothetical protein
MARYRTDERLQGDEQLQGGTPADPDNAAGFESGAALATTVETSPAVTRGKDKRVLYIIGRMQAHEWRGHASELALSAEWGIPATTVKSLAQEAGRHLRLVKSPELARDWCMAQLHRIIESTESEAAKLGAIKLVLEHTECRSWSENERPYVATPEQQIEMLVAELTNPGPELVEALQRTGWERTLPQGKAS